MTDVVVGTLRIRGGGGRRLAGIAARALPAALDDALSGLPELSGPAGADVSIPTLVIPIPADLLVPGAYDDDTLALLWADLVRAAATRALAGVGGPASGPAPSPGRSAPGDGAPPLAATVAAALAWLDAGAPSTLPAALAGALTGQGGRLGPASDDGETSAEALVAALGPAVAARLADRLRRLAPPTVRAGVPARAPRRTAPDRADDSRPRTPDPVAEAQERAAEAPPALASGRPPATPVTPPAEAAASDALARAAADVAPWVDLARHSGTSTADLAGATAVAGLVLLYPWLAELGRDAEVALPHIAPVQARRFALQALVAPTHGPDEPPPGRRTTWPDAVPDGVPDGVLDDPLVLFLAGAGVHPLPGTGLRPLDPAAAADLRDAADAVLGRFAGLLRGFERSTPAFVREAWVVRPGLLDREREPAHLDAAAAPLDVLLPTLPYPVSLLRLPWTGPLVVRMRP